MISSHASAPEVEFDSTNFEKWISATLRFIVLREMRFKLTEYSLKI